MADVRQTLVRLLEAGKLEPYIRYIRFPLLRNLAENTQIDFTYPITALVGPNGTNKTAILRALQGCPDYENLGMHWFSTDLDPISTETRHRFIHGYLAPSLNEIVEVIKTRILTSNPDYFEPSRPILRDGMPRMPKIDPAEKMSPERVRTRWKAVNKRVVYLDFRSELSAFDKYWFHVPYTKRVANLSSKKSLIRRRSSHLSKALTSAIAGLRLYKTERITEAAHDLTAMQVAAVSAILGRDYESVRVIGHRFFDVSGYTVLLKSKHLRYSEAFAGSGEFAVVMLVKAVTEADDKSLILLDEPETSLHPGAQRKLLAFLSEQVKLKCLQVVLSTHAPEIVRDLPSDAIKVLQARQSDGKIQLVSQSSHASEAFFRLGATTGEEFVIFVEDILAAAIIRRAIRPLGEAIYSIVTVSPLPGGAGAIQTRFVPSFAQSNRQRCLVFLDGDQRPATSNEDLQDVGDADLIQALEARLRGKPQISMNGANGLVTPSERTREYRRILSWSIENVAFMPGLAPESFLLEMVGEGPDSPTAEEAKTYWVQKTTSSLGREDWEQVSSADILNEQERALAAIDPNHDGLVFIRDRVEVFINAPKREEST